MGARYELEGDDVTRPLPYLLAITAVALVAYALSRPVAGTDAAPVPYGRATVIVVQREGGGP